MSLIEIEKNDTILIRDGRSIRVQRIRRPSGTITMIEGIDESDPSPIMLVVFAKDIMRVVRKSGKGKVTEMDKLPPEMKVNPPKDVTTLEKVKEEVATRDLPGASSAKNVKVKK